MCMYIHSQNYILISSTLLSSDCTVQHCMDQCVHRIPERSYH